MDKYSLFLLDNLAENLTGQNQFIKSIRYQVATVSTLRANRHIFYADAFALQSQQGGFSQEGYPVLTRNKKDAIIS